MIPPILLCSFGDGSKNKRSQVGFHLGGSAKEVMRMFYELSATVVAFVALFAVVDMTIFGCLAGGALGTDDHRCSASR
jgi:nucleoside permease NupC